MNLILDCCTSAQREATTSSMPKHLQREALRAESMLRLLKNEAAAASGSWEQA